MPCPAWTLQQRKVSFQTALCTLPRQPPLVRLSPSRALCLLTVPPTRPSAAGQQLPRDPSPAPCRKDRSLAGLDSALCPRRPHPGEQLLLCPQSPLLLTHHVRAEGSSKAREVTVLLCLQLSAALRPALKCVHRPCPGVGAQSFLLPPDTTLPAPPSTIPTSSLLRREAPGLQMWVLLSWFLTVSLSTASRKTSLSQMTLRPPVATSSFTLICFLLITCQNAGEAVERREPSYTAGGNVNRCSYNGELYEGSVKT